MCYTIIVVPIDQPNYIFSCWGKRYKDTSILYYVYQQVPYLHIAIQPKLQLL